MSPVGRLAGIISGSAKLSRDTSLLNFVGARMFTAAGTQSVSTSIERVFRIYLGYTEIPAYDFVLGLPGHYNVTTGAYPTEIAAAFDILVRGVSIGYGVTQDPTAATWVRGNVSAGSQSATISAGTNTVGLVTDTNIAQGSAIPAGRHVWAMGAINVASGGTVPKVCYFGPGSIEGATSSTSTSQVPLLTNGAAITVGANGAGDYGPVFVACRGFTARPAALCIGDSIGAAANETQFSQDTGVKGFFSRGLLAAGWHLHNACVAGSAPHMWLDNGRTAVANKLDLIKLVTTLNSGAAPFQAVISEHGTNSASEAGGSSGAHAVTAWNTNSAFVANMKAYLALAAAEWPGVPIYQTTILPKVTTTDGNTTLANQTPISGFGSGGWIDNFNSKLLADNLDGTIAGGISLAAVYGDVSDKHKIPVPAWSSTLAAAYTSGDANITLTDAPTTKMYLWSAGMPASGAVPVQSVSGTGPYTVKLATTIGVSLSSGAAIYSPESPEGTHPTAVPHSGRLATAVRDWALTKG